MAFFIREKRLDQIIDDAKTGDCKPGENLIQAYLELYGQPCTSSLPRILHWSLQHLKAEEDSNLANKVKRDLEIAYPVSNTLVLQRGIIFSFGLDTPICNGVKMLQSDYHYIITNLHATSFNISVRSSNGKTEVMVKAEGSLPPIAGKVFPEIKSFLSNHCRGAFMAPYDLKVRWF